MIQLPSNLTTAALALLLGALLGAGGYHVLSPDQEPRQAAASTPIVELGRYLQPRDTTGEEEADTEIRYRTRTETRNVCEGDTTVLPVPSNFRREELFVSDAQPLQIGVDQVTWTAWDTDERRYEQRIYEVPSQAWEWGLYGVAQVRNPPRLGLPGATRWAAGIGGEVRYRRITLQAETTISPALKPEVTATLRYDL